MSIVLCEKCLCDLVKKEVVRIQSCLKEDANTYDFEPSDITLLDLYLDDEEEKNFFLTFDDKKKYFNWHYKVHGRAHLMEHPDAEDYLDKVVNMRDECIDMLYNALDGGFDILINNSFKNKIETQKIITKCVRKFINVNKNKSDYYVYITIRPDSSKIKFQDFKDKMTKLFKLKCIEKSYYVYEQKYNGENNELGYGFHIHGLIKFNTNQNFGNAKQQLERSVRALKMINKIDKFIGDEIWIDKMYYMGIIWKDENNFEENMDLNYKNDIEKNKCLQYDKRFRIENGLDYVIN